MRSVVLYVALVGCGRIAFDARGDANDTCSSYDVLPIPTTGLATGMLTASSHAQGSCGGDATSEDVYELDVSVAGSGLLLAADLPNEVAVPILYARTACDDPASEVACDTMDGEALFPEIHLATVPLGNYYVFVDGFNAAAIGSYTATLQVLLPPSAPCDPTNQRERCGGDLACASNVCMPTTCTVTQPFSGLGPFNFIADTTGAPNLHAGSCGDATDGGLRGPELVYSVTLPSAVSDMIVSTDNAMTDFDTLIYVRSSCGAGEIACDDDGGTTVNHSSIAHTGAIPAGQYYVFIDGFGVNSGTAQVTITTTP